LSFGLAAYVFTHDAARPRRMKDAFNCGWLEINDLITHPPDVTFGN